MKITILKHPKGKRVKFPKQKSNIVDLLFFKSIKDYWESIH